MRKSERLITFLIISGPPTELPLELISMLKSKGWQTLRQGQVYALFWDSVLQIDTSDADRLMQRVLEIHKIASQFHINHSFKTVRTTDTQAGISEMV